MSAPATASGRGLEACLDLLATAENRVSDMRIDYLW